MMEKLTLGIVASFAVMSNLMTASIDTVSSFPTEASTPQTKPNYQISLNTTLAQPIAVTSNVRTPDFDTDVLIPLRAAQAAQAEKARQETARAASAKTRATAQAKALATAKQVPVNTAPASADVEKNLEQIRYCESGGRYHLNTKNGYYGAYQYSKSTWGNYGGFATADLAPAAVQDAKARDSVARRGYQPWGSCAARLGLR